MTGRGWGRAGFAVCLFASVVAGAAPTLLKNINTQPVARSSDPVYIGNAGTNMLFVGKSPSGSGTALWRTDGTSAGTLQVPGIRPSGSQFPPRIQGRDRVIFIGADSGDVSRVMSSDGTAAGTSTLSTGGAILQVGAVGSLVDGTAIFSVKTFDGASALWASDGTPANTRVLGNVIPAASSRDTVTAGGRLFFIASSLATGEELWTTDGTVAGTRVVVDVEPGQAGSAPRIIGSSALYLYLAAGTDTPARLWRISKSTGSAELYAGVNPADAGAFFQPGVVEVPGGAIFVSNTDLVFHNDATGQVSQIVDFTPGLFNDQAYILGRIGQRALFAATTPGAGAELWISDGSISGTLLVRDLRPGVDGSYPEAVGQIDNQVVFSFTDSSGERVLWRTDGTSIGTVPLASSLAADPGTDPLVFAWPRFSARSIWRVNRATGSAREFRADFSIPEFDQTMRIDDTYFFSGSSGTQGNEPALSDSTGTRFIADLQVQSEDGQSGPSAFVGAGSFVYFVASPSDTERGLWKTDGTSSGTVPVYSPGSDASRAGGRALVSVGNRIYYMAADSQHGMEPWVSDGTPAGTHMLRDIAPGSAWSISEETQRPLCQRRWIAQLGNYAYFAASDGTHGTELWRTDGSEAGTQQFLELASGSLGVSICGFYAWNGLLFFEVTQPSGSAALYRTDGTVQGTFAILTLETRTTGGLWHDFVPFDGKLVFSTYGSARRIWSTDGTAAGTTQVAFASDPQFVPRTLAGAVAGRLIVSGGRGNDVGLFSLATLSGAPAFLASSCGADYLGEVTGGLLFIASGSGICVSDATPAGTRSLGTEIYPVDPSVPGLFLPRNGVVHFFAQPNRGPTQLMKSDGTATGTVAASANANVLLGYAMSPLGPVFAGTAPDTGQELWLWASAVPVANNDTATVASGASVDIDVIANDTNAEGTLVPRLVRIVEAPGAGAATVTASGAIRYTAPAGFSGSTFLRYAVSNSFGSESMPAQLEITVSASPPPGGGGGTSGGNASSGTSGGGAFGLVPLALLIAAMALRLVRLITSVSSAPPGVGPQQRSQCAGVIRIW